MINITIDGRPLSLEKPINLLEAALSRTEAYRI